MARRGRPALYAFHPVKVWMDRNGISCEELSRLVSAEGGSMAPGYALRIRNGHANPGYQLAEILERVTGGVVTIRVFMLWKPVPLRRVRAAS